MNEAFRSKVESTLQNTVLAWDRDPTLLRQCRQSIFQSQFYKEYRQQQQQPQPPRDGIRTNSSCNTKHFMKQFVKYFQNHVMIWCNQPTCHVCAAIQQQDATHRATTNSSTTDSNTDTTTTTTTTVQPVGTRGPITLEEIHGQAHRVEVYQCTKCHTELTFPRYNNVATLYHISSQQLDDETTALPKQRTPGRCGEYANLFGLYCRALGLETRYILDYTDHVWIEVLLPVIQEPVENTVEFGVVNTEICSHSETQWCMLDSCEGVMDEYSMYEHGWGKALNYCIAISSTCIIDVTTKYTRQFQTPEFQHRRRHITTSEYDSTMILQNMNQSILNTANHTKLSLKERNMIEQRNKEELMYLQYLSTLTSWLPSSSSTTTSKQQLYQMGRISGSHQWKATRNEIGNHPPDRYQDTDSNNTSNEMLSKKSTTSGTTTHHNNHPDYDTTTNTPTTTIQERFPWLGRVETAYNTCYQCHNTAHHHSMMDEHPFEIYLIPPMLPPQSPPPIHHTISGNESNTTIRINHVACATATTTNQPQLLSVVVMDEHFDDATSSSSTSSSSTSSCIGGCILQSVVCCTMTDLVQFLSSIPPQRIIMMVGAFSKNNRNDDADTNNEPVVEHNALQHDSFAATVKRLLGEHFNTQYLYDDGIIYMGQLLVTKQPDWSYCGSYSMTPNGMKFIVSPIPLLLPPSNDGITQTDINTSVAAMSTTSTTMAEREKHMYVGRKEERFRLKTFRNVRPQNIVGRVPDTIMNLSEQVVAGYEKKRTAFLLYIKQNQYPTAQQQVQNNTTSNTVASSTISSDSSGNNNHTNIPPSQRCYGYTTKYGAPIYLLGPSSYPLVPCRRQPEYIAHNSTKTKKDDWNTFLWLPSELVPENDTGILDDDINVNSSKFSVDSLTKASPQYDIPIDQEFFEQELGSSLLLSLPAQDPCRLPTIEALHNTRFVAYYFSAHWCGRKWLCTVMFLSLIIYYSARLLHKLVIL